MHEKFDFPSPLHDLFSPGLYDAEPTRCNTRLYSAPLIELEDISIGSQGRIHYRSHENSHVDDWLLQDDVQERLSEEQVPEEIIQAHEVRSNERKSNSEKQEQPASMVKDSKDLKRIREKQAQASRAYRLRKAAAKKAKTHDENSTDQA